MTKRILIGAFFIVMFLNKSSFKFQDVVIRAFNLAF